MLSASITVLGSGSGLPQAGRATSGYLFKAGDRLNLIDCGGGVTSSFLRRGFDPLAVDRIFISHTHPDHVCELPLFLQLIYLKGRKEKFELYLPSEFVKPFEAYLPALYLIREKFPFELEIKGYEPGEIYNDNFVMTAIANDHLKPYSKWIDRLSLPNRMQCNSFEIEINDNRLFYSADIADFRDVRTLLTDQKVVIIESTHIDLGELLSFAKTSLIKKFVLTHLGGDDEVLMINKMATELNLDHIITAIDGLEISLQ